MYLRGAYVCGLTSPTFRVRKHFQHNTAVYKTGVYCCAFIATTQYTLHTHTTTVLRPIFPGPPACAGARRELLDFMVQGEINRGRHTEHPAGRHSIRTNQCPPPPSPHFFTGRMPFLPPNQQCQSTEGN